MLERICLRACVAVAATIGALSPALAQKNYGPGVSDTEIKIGNIMPYSGPASAYGAIGRTEAAYFKMINDQGGINGRKVDFISYDDGFSPPKSVEQARKLIEGDEVLLVFQPLGTAPNVAIQKYLNGKKVPHLFIASGATRFGDPKNFAWTMGWQPNYQARGGSTPNTSWTNSRTARSRCSGRTTMPARMRSRGCVTALATRPAA